MGTFDEAFKSRIQLTLRYKNLGVPQRRQIWENFIKRLESFPDPKDQTKSQSSSKVNGGVDFGIKSKEVRAKLDELAEAELNGREIRNAISTARQLAMFRKERMGYEHIQIVIEEAKKFNKYLKDLNQGYTTDQIMKDAGERMWNQQGKIALQICEINDSWITYLQDSMFLTQGSHYDRLSIWTLMIHVHIEPTRMLII